MTAPTRVLAAGGERYALDPYVRDTAGRFACKPTEPLPPLAMLEAAGVVVDVVELANGAVLISGDPTRPNYWKVRTVRDEDGTFRVLYLEGDAAA